MTNQESVTATTKLEILIRLRNQVFEKLTFSNIELEYATNRKFKISGDERKDIEQAIKKIKEMIEQNQSILEIVEKQMAEETEKQIKDAEQT